MSSVRRARRFRWTVGPLAAATLAIAAALPAGASAASDLTVTGSVNQVHVTDADVGERVNLLSSKGKRIASKPAGGLGGIVFRRVPAGKGYRVRDGAGQLSGRVSVLSDRSKPKSTEIYNQTLPAGGYGYVSTRDGTQLAIAVRLPGPSDEGPYPTMVEYSGYGYANPAGPESGLSQLANILGYAVVDVNMRGTGCSGGAFDFFEPLQGLDGYDVIETVARRPG
jgi:dipeptidyl aminopeptidase/acylaminoacyl peptidase